MSLRFPIGVATMYNPVSTIVIILLFIFIISCSPVNLSTQPNDTTVDEITKQEKQVIIDKKKENIQKTELKNNNEKSNDFDLKKNITILFSNTDDQHFTNQFINILELGVYNKNLQNIIFDIYFYENESELEKIIFETKKPGKIYIGPISTKNTKVASRLCDHKIIFFSFSSDTKLAGNCIYLLNFFPKNELEELFESLNKESKIALLYPENDYGYAINFLIDEVANNSEAIIVNRSSYKNDLSNVRDSIKELGKYELRKYELNRQKQTLSLKKDEQSKKRLKKLNKFKTTKDYDFTHILIADYGLNLLQVAPLLPYYDIDPNTVQFLSTGVIDDKNFFLEPSLQGTNFPGVEINKRINLVNQYKEIYNENMLRISTLPYDLMGLINYIYSRNISYNQLKNLLNSSVVKFEGVDGEFYFKNNMIERELDILQISNGVAKKIN